jgi:hypothetical protein
VVNKKNLRSVGALGGRKSEEWGHGATQAIMLTLGMLYRLSGRNREARDCFKPHIKLGIDLLSDDDPDNDWIAYSKMSKVFNHAGDERNFRACVAANPKWVWCDGACGLTATPTYGFSACRYCVNIDFCENCLELLKRDELPAKRCSPRHSFIEYRTLDRAPRRGIVRVGDEEIPVGEWLGRIKRAWDL